MLNHSPYDNATSNVLAWSSHGANVEPATEEDAAADADEPPDPDRGASRFQKTTVRQGRNHHESLLTKALQSQSEDDASDHAAAFVSPRRRRSITSNASIASTGELTSDTGITTPARTSSPSPPLPYVGFAPIAAAKASLRTTSLLRPAVFKQPPPLAPAGGSATPTEQGKSPAAPAAEKKRCISFACGAKPAQKDASIATPPQKAGDATTKPAAQEMPARPCIKFACPVRPTALQTPPARDPEAQKPTRKASLVAARAESPATVRKLRSSSASQSRCSRSATPRRSGQSPALASKRYLTAESHDLQSESARFHEFASDEPQEDDWIRQDMYAARRKLTIDDTLKMELAIRRLGKEAEEEAEQEDDEEGETAETPDGDDVDDVDGDVEADEDVVDEDEEDNNSGDGSDDDISDGYKTDNETGFASSEDEDDDLVLWSTSTRQPAQPRLPKAVASVQRQPSFGENSDSSAYSLKNTVNTRPRRRKNRDIPGRFRPGTPELPDSTDFVCGTLDEDRPIEEAYKSCIAARKREKLHLIPQDIDPSFPTSGPEDEGGEELFKPAQHDSDDHVWVHGELEDLHHEQDKADRRKKKGESPRRYHSPPPKPRGRSPRRLFDRHSPLRRMRSPPPPQMVTSPPASPVLTGEGMAFKALAFRPGLTHTKSLPRAPVMFPTMKQHRRGRANTMTKDRHVRGAIDIVKGLEQKRQRRREKFQQKYCSRARKGQVHDKRPQPGLGAERMKELGLLIGGKLGQGNYVLSF